MKIGGKKYKMNQDSLEAIPILGGLFNDNGKADAKRAEARLQEASDLYKGLKPPEQTDVSYENDSWLNDLSPEQIQTVLQGDSAMGGISTDPRLKQAQMDALNSMQGIASSGGMTAADTANLSKINTDVSTVDRGRRDSIKQGMQQRGQSGSGLELLAQLQSNQAATDRQAQGGLDVAGMAQARALDAMQRGGQMSGQMQAQDFGQQAQIAQARDAISRFNTGNMNQNNQYNANNVQQANQYNNAGRQGIQSQNVGTRNQATQQNHGNAQQDFENQRSVIDGQAGALGALRNHYQNRSDTTAKVKSEATGQLIRGGVAYASGGASEGMNAANGATQNANTAPNQSTVKQKQWWE